MSGLRFFHKKVEEYGSGGELLDSVLGSESWFLMVPGLGAVEAWRSKAVDPELRISPTGFFGGVEVHSKTARDHFVEIRTSCWVNGGKCWSSGSSSAFESVEFLFDDPVGVRNVLQDWADEYFLGGSGEEDRS